MIPARKGLNIKNNNEVKCIDNWIINGNDGCMNECYDRYYDEEDDNWGGGWTWTWFEYWFLTDINDVSNFK